MRHVKHAPTVSAVLCLILAFTSTGLRAASAADAPGDEEPMSFEECKKQLNKYASTLARQPDKLVFKEAKERCKEGDIEGAKKVIQNAIAVAKGSYGEGEDAYQKCLDDLDEYVKRYNLKPDRATTSEARALCKKGEPRSAMRVIGRPQ